MKEKKRGLLSKILNAYLNLCYVAGIQTVRIVRRMIRRTGDVLRPLGAWLVRKGTRILQKLFQWFILWPWEEMGQILSRRKEAAARWKEAKSQQDFLRIVRLSGIFLGKTFGMLLNVALPVIGILFFLSVLQEVRSAEYCLEVSDNGTVIGYAENENVVHNAETLVVERTGTELSGQVITPMIRLTTQTEETSLMSDTVLCNAILRRSDDRLIQATGFYVNGECRFAVESKMDLRYMLQKILSEHRDENTLEIGFADEITLEDGLYYAGLVITSEEADHYLRQMQKSVYTYTVQSGDTLLSIAKQAGMTEKELLELNPGLEVQGIPAEGSLLFMQTEKSRLSIRRVQEETGMIEVAYRTVKKRSSNLNFGYTTVSQKGVAGQTERVDAVTYVDDEEVSRENLSQTVLSNPVEQIILVGTRIRSSCYFYMAADSAAGDYAWPVPASRLVWQGYSAYHDAIDISARPGIGIVAAKEGVVTSAGWHSGYGYCMTIRHPNGDTSFYAHCSKLLVSSGDTVVRGQSIARVGNTGSWSQGSHLHFEIRVNGRTVNPLNYISG